MNQMVEQPLPIALPDAPSAAPAVDPAPAESSEESIWADLRGEQGLDDAGETEDVVTAVEGDLEIVEQPVVTPATVATTPAPAPTPVPAPVQPVPVPVQAPIPVETPPLQQVAPVTPPVVAPTTTPFNTEAWEVEQVTNLTKFYAINEEDAQRLQTEPELVLPQMAARMHLDVTKSVMASMQAMLPQLMHQQTQQQAIEQEARKTFYSANPDLDRPELEPVVLQIGGMFRAANKTADPATAAKMIGDMVRLSLGLQAPQPTAQAAPVTAPAPVVAPSAPKPFTPSMGGGTGSPVKQSNEWTELISDD